MGVEAVKFCELPHFWICAKICQQKTAHNVGNPSRKSRSVNGWWVRKNYHQSWWLPTLFRWLLIKEYTCLVGLYLSLFQYTSWKNPQNSCGQTNNFRSAPNTSFTKNMTQKQKLPTKIKRVSGETVHILRTAEGGSVFPLAVYNNSRCYLYSLWRLTGPLPQSPPRAFFCFFVVIVVSFVQQST